MTSPNLLLVLLLQEEWYKVPDTGVMGQAPIKQNQTKLSGIFIQRVWKKFPGVVGLKNILWNQLDLRGRMREKVSVVSGDCFGDCLLAGSAWWHSVQQG